jgi:hypothetical protein
MARICGLLRFAVPAALTFLFAVAATAQQEALVGETIYRQGLLPGGAPLHGSREVGAGVEGDAAACVACHRRSGLGTAEGQVVIPPITGKYLFRPGGRLEDLDMVYAQGNVSLDHGAYSDATLARAIREGVGRNGRKLSPLMPRFDLDDAAMASLIAYLKNLSAGPVPGVSDDTLDFATIIAPDADPAARRGMLDVLDRFFADKNDFIRGGRRPMQDSRSVGFRVTRRWQLHVWELSGAPGTWEKQLRERLASEPVFAVISGIGGKTWAPIHHFCEKAGLPCLFPNVDLPVVAEKDFYPVYFSKGVRLEAELIADAVGNDKGIHRLVQVYRPDDIGAAAAASLSAAAREAGLRTQDRPLAAGDGAPDFAAALAPVEAGDALVLWLRPPDLARLPAPPAQAGQVFVSGLMGGMEAAPLPAAWRPEAQLTYPVDLPQLRQYRTTYPHTWFRIKHIPVVADRIQSDTYLACGIVSEVLSEMLDSFRRDYLVERIEDMLSRRVLTGYYPHLGLAPGQRFASKGGYLVRLSDPSGDRLAAEGEWRIP